MSWSPRIGAVVALAILGGIVATSVVLIQRESDYFDQPSRAGLSGIGDEGETFYVGLADLTVHPGDAVRLIALDGVPTSARPLAARLGDTSAAIGVLQERFIDHVSSYRELVGSTFTFDDGPFQILVLIPAGRQDVEFSLPTLSFSVNAGPSQRQKLVSRVRICSTVVHPDRLCEAPNPPRNPEWRR
jgi:hypothetical protein